VSQVRKKTRKERGTSRRREERVKESRKVSATGRGLDIEQKKKKKISVTPKKRGNEPEQGKGRQEKSLPTRGNIRGNSRQGGWSVKGRKVAEQWNSFFWGKRPQNVCQTPVSRFASGGGGEGVAWPSKEVRQQGRKTYPKGQDGEKDEHYNKAMESCKNPRATKTRGGKSAEEGISKKRKKKRFMGEEGPSIKGAVEGNHTGQ